MTVAAETADPHAMKVEAQPMCQFCVEHGEGERWYLQAKNYACDLDSDLRRREYVVDFISGFEMMRANTISAMKLLEKLPSPLERAGKNAISRRMRPIHFGQPVPLEDCEAIFDIATSITAIPCICRMHAPNQNADEVCILVTTQPMEAVLQEGFSSYANGPELDDFHRMSKEQALALLRQCESRGLMHSIWTFQTPFTAAICNCNLESGCMAMKLTVGHDTKLMWRGEAVAVFNRDACSGCRRCAKVCPFDAIDASNRGPVTGLAEKCWGCGICRSACPNAAISLVNRREVPAVSNLW